MSPASASRLRSAKSWMGASGSLLTAITLLDPIIPVRCWTAPDIPNAM